MLDLTLNWRSYPILSVDFETTGKYEKTCEPVEVAVVRYEGGAIVGRFSSLLKPTAPIPAEATGVHGITDEMVADAPTLEEISHELVKLSEGAIPLAFNANFDRTVMHRYLSGEGVALFDPTQSWLCSFAMAWHKDRFEPGTGRLKLEACCKRRGINIVGAHRAMADALASGALFFSLMGASETTMGKLLETVAKLSEEQQADHAAYRKKVREQDRLVWRGYAQALATASAGQYAAADIARIADALLSAEKERFV